MANCEICGKEDELYDTLIEGTRLNVCSKCSKFGKVMKKQVTKEERVIKTRKIEEKKSGIETVELINPNYSELIKKKREQLGLKQIELAKKIAEKESLIHKLESGHVEPSVAVARKLEKFLGIKLIREEEIKKMQLKTKSENLTIGDIIDVK